MTFKVFIYIRGITLAQSQNVRQMEFTFCRKTLHSNRFLELGQSIIHTHTNKKQTPMINNLSPSLVF